MALEFGQNLGLAVDLQADKRINDLRYQQEQMRLAKAQSEAKAKMFADDLDFQNAANSFDNPRIKEFAKNQINKIGQFISENPDWQTNVDKRMQLNFMKRELKDNPDLLRGMAVDNEYKKLLADMAEVAKNPRMYDVEAYQELQNQFNNYFKTGNKYGDPSKGIEPPTYFKPQELIDVTSTALKAGKDINNFNVIKGKALGEYITQPKPEEVKAIKDSLLKQHNRSIMLQARELGLNTPQQVDDWLTKSIMAGFEPKYSPGDPNALWERGMREREFNQRERKMAPKPASYTPFDDLFDKRKPAGNVPAEIVQKVWGKTPKVGVQANTIVGKNYSGADLTGLPVTYDNRYVTDSRGVRYLTGSVNVPMNVAKAKGIADEEGMTEAFLGKGVRRGEGDKEYVEMSVMIPIDEKDGTARQLYNTYAQPDKLVEGLTESQATGQAPSRQPVSGTKQEFLQAGYSEEQIQRGVNEGLIQLQ